MLHDIDQSIQLLLHSHIDYEFRTTVVKELHTKEDFLSIASWIKGCPAYYLQAFEENEGLIANYQTISPTSFSSYSKDELESIKSLLTTLDIPTSIRGL